MRRLAGLLIAAISCGDSPRTDAPSAPSPPGPSTLERTIATQLSDKLGRPATVSCTEARCRADLGDTVLPIAIAKGSGDWSWSVEGLLVRAAPIEAYLREALVDLGAPQRVTCGAAIRSVAAGARIECALERGGKAFAVIAADGRFSTEIELDPAAAQARSTDGTQLTRTTGSAGSGTAPDDD